MLKKIIRCSENMKIGDKKFDLKNKTYIMGIIDVTRDSFYKQSRYPVLENAVERAIEIESEGADIIDIGGESAKPGYTQISSSEEISRVVPAIKAVKKETDLPISIDTRKADVAREAINAGADFVNDIWGLKYDKEMAKVVADADVSVCISGLFPPFKDELSGVNVGDNAHIKENRKSTTHNSLMDEVIKDMKGRIDIALNHDINQNKIIIDPGIGYTKNMEQNLELISKLNKINELNYPLLLAISRKPLIGNLLDVPTEERLVGTITLNMIGIFNNVSILRVHDVKEHAQMIKIVDEVYKFHI